VFIPFAPEVASFDLDDTQNIVDLFGRKTPFARYANWIQPSLGLFAILVRVYMPRLLAVERAQMEAVAFPDQERGHV
jgi:hypothetical protein